MAVSKITDFQKRVFRVLQTVPKGSVTTYKYLAEAVGVNSALAIGQALKRNPFAPEIPCHRVISSDLSIGGYAGAREGKLVQKKKKILESEGVLFAGNFLKETSRLYRPKSYKQE